MQKESMMKIHIQSTLTMYGIGMNQIKIFTKQLKNKKNKIRKKFYTLGWHIPQNQLAIKKNLNLEKHNQLIWILLRVD